MEACFIIVLEAQFARLHLTKPPAVSAQASDWLTALLPLHLSLHLSLVS